MSVKIYKPAKNAMQSGKAKCNKWVVEFTSEPTRFIEPLMGWTGNSDTKGQLKISFDSKERAIAYAEHNNLEYKIIEPKSAKTIIRSYAENFS